MDFSIIILTFLFLVLIALFAFCLTEPRGKNTVYARKDAHATSSIAENTKEKASGLKPDPISQSNEAAYSLQKQRTEAA
jgi:hypothetical protein